MNVEIGAEAAQFSEKEYINGIAVAVWLVAGRNTHGGGSLSYRANCGTVHTVLYFKGLSILMYRPCQLPSRSSVISGELQTGGNSICLYLTGVLL
jgi:hypothetical protein